MQYSFPKKLLFLLLPLALGLAPSSEAAPRLLEALDMNVARGQTNRLQVSLEAQGNERTAAFSLCYDRSLLTFLGAVRGSQATNAGATLSVNSSQAASAGRVGLTVTLPAGHVLPAGPNTLVEAIFRAAAGTNFVTTQVSVCSQPVALKVADVAGVALTTATADATVILMGPCGYSLSTNAVFMDSAGGLGAAVMNAGLGCPWNVENTNSWIAVLSGASRTGPGSVSLVVAANPSLEGRTAVLTVAGLPFTVNQTGAPCGVSISPNSRIHGNGAGTNSVNVTADPGCTWTTVNTNDWLVITSGASGTGTGSVNYVITPNPTLFTRTGTVVIADQVLTLVQQGFVCSYHIVPSDRRHGAGMASNAVALTTSNLCSWTVANTSSWIIITSPTNGTGDANVSYKVLGNPTFVERMGVVTIADQFFTVTQAAADCAYKISPTNRTHGYGMATGVVSVTASEGCNWDVVNTNGWITITSDAHGAGSGSVGYEIAANPAGVERAGVVVIAGQAFMLTQRAVPCTVEISPGIRTHGYGMATGTVTVTTAIGCVWSATSSKPWITITSATNGSGPGGLSYTIEANPASWSRTGLVTVADQTMMLIQRGAPCTLDLSPSAREHGYAATTGTVSVATALGCPWSATSTNEWITILSSTNGTGSGGLTYALAANPITLERMGVIMVGDQVLTLTQHAAPCDYALSPTRRAHGSGMETGLVSVATSTNCGWSVVNTNGWIAITSGGNGLGTSTFSYRVESNPSQQPRAGTLAIDSETFLVTQAGASCPALITPTNGQHGAGSETGLVSVTAQTNCQWIVVNTNEWITIRAGKTGSGNATVIYSVDANQSLQSRTGTLLIAGEPYLVSQAAATCSYRLSPASRVHGHGAITATLSVITITGCPWRVTNTNDWVTLLSDDVGTNGATVTYAIAANPALVDRSGVVTIADQSFSLTQRATPCSLSISPSARTHGFAGATGEVIVTTVTGCPWSIINTNDWIIFTSATNGTTSASASYEVAANPIMAPRIGVVQIGDALLTITQRPLPCVRAMEPVEVSHGYGAETGLVTVTTGGGCTWIAFTTNDWIILTAGTNGLGDGSVSYNLAENPTGVERRGFILSDGPAVTVRQAGAPCTFAISPLERAHNSGMDTGIVTVTTLSGCPWEVIHTNDWIVFTSGDTGLGTANASYMIAANPAAWARTGVVSIANQTFTIRQEAAACTYALSTDHMAVGFGGGTGQVGVLTLPGCSWNATSSNTWIVITSELHNPNGGMSFTVASNAGPRGRSGVIRIANQLFTVTQGAPPEPLKPVVRITSPGPNLRTTNWTVSGTAQDNAGVAAVSVAVGAGEFLPANGTSPWSINLEGILAPGNNVIRAKSIDFSGNQSVVVTQRFYFVATSPITVRTNGLGAMTPNLKGRLEVGRTYTVVATPGAGYVFSNWTGSVAASNASLTFVMRSNLILTANFVPNPFTPIKGIYNGLFATSPAGHEGSGYFTLALSERGSFTATMLTGGRRLAFSGAFDLSGVASGFVPRPLTNALNVELLADLTPGGRRIIGRVTDGTLVSELTADRAMFNAVTNRATNFAGIYTLLLPGAAVDPTGPAGTGFGTLTVDLGGGVRFSGTLADGTLITQRGSLSQDGDWPLYAPLYGGKGSLLSKVTFTNDVTDDLSGEFAWTKPASTLTKIHPAGFVHRTTLTGSRYTPPGTNSILPFTDGRVSFDGGNLEFAFTNHVTLGAGGRITNLDSNKLTLTVAPPSGLFTGVAGVPGVNKTIAFKGAVHQKQMRAAGFFLGTNQSGAMTLER
jgi:hypothetical protein